MDGGAEGPRRREETLAAVGECLREVFRGALEARRVPAGGERLTADWQGEWAGEKLAAIRLRFRLQADPARHGATVDRVLGFYAAHCRVKKRLAPEAMVRSEVVWEPEPETERAVAHPGRAGAE